MMMVARDPRANVAGRFVKERTGVFQGKTVCKRKGEGGNAAGDEEVADTVAVEGEGVSALAATHPPTPNKNTTPVISATRRVRDIDREDTMQHTPLKG